MKIRSAVLEFTRPDGQIDRYGEAKRHIFVTFGCEHF
jgi:hypothetical protein